MTETPAAGADAEIARLEELVARTSGPQPWRRVFHAVNGVAIAAAVTWWPFSHTAAVGALGSIVLGLLVFDFVRLTMPPANRLFFTWFNHLASPREAERVASSTWYMMGITCAVAIAPGPTGISAILVMSLADPAASYFGRRWGQRPFLGGSVEGSIVFMLVALAVLLPRHAWPVALGVAVAATLLERRSWPLDDNLAVPVGCALILRALEAGV